MSGDLVLLPSPRRLRREPGHWSWEPATPIQWPEQPPDAAAAARRAADVLGVAAADRPAAAAAPTRGITLAEEAIAGTAAAEGYRLQVRPEGVRIGAATAAGWFYGAITLRQLLRRHGPRLPALEIEDHPDVRIRGVMLDISRDKVPTLQTLFDLVDWLAELKLNHLQLYTEHTFAYRNHREVWADADPLTAEDIRALDDYCAERFVELAPNQNSFGHLRRWLVHPRYLPLAECTGTFPFPWGGTGQGPFSLNPLHPGSLALLADWYQELLPNFRSTTFNVGCDETFDLGFGASRAACEARGKGRVYLEFLLKIHELCRRHGRTMQFWGDIILKHPELVPELPDDVIALNWGYEAGHPFERECAVFAEAGREFLVCPGTSSWLSLTGRTDNALANLVSAAEQGLRFGALGILITDWGDDGHWQPPPVSDVGMAAGAAYAWCLKANRDAEFAECLDAHRYLDAAGVMGRLAMDAGLVHTTFRSRPSNRSMLHQLLVLPPEQLRASGVTEQEIQEAEARLEVLLSRLSGARPAAGQGGWAHEEWAQALRLARHGCRRAAAVLTGRDLPDRALDRLIAEQRRLWLSRNRTGGLAESLARFERVRVGTVRRD